MNEIALDQWAVLRDAPRADPSAPGHVLEMVTFSTSALEEDCNLCRTREKARLHRRALAARALDVDNARAVMGGHGRGVVTGVVVHHNQLVDEVIVDEDRIDHGADCRGLVSREEFTSSASPMKGAQASR